MGVYPQKISDRLRRLSFAGDVANGNADGTSASFECGAFANLVLMISEPDGRIDSAGFRTSGCGFMVAAADVISEWASGKKLADLHGLKDSELSDVVVHAVGAYPPGRGHCATVVFEALRSALANYREHRLEEFAGEVPLICTCFGVSEPTILEAIREKRLSEVEEVSAVCRAGSGCGSCRMLIRELLDMRALETT